MTTVVAQSAGHGGADSPLGTVCPPARPAETLRWSRFLAATEAEGPGVRSAVWLQGCAVHCPECFNPQLWADRGGRVTGTAAIAADWAERALAAGAEGVTLLGGEPFDQAAAAASVARIFGAAGLGVMTFTGYPLDRLTAWADAGRDDIAALLAATDLLCDGPYLRDLPDMRRPWVGSRNQGIRALGPRYATEVSRIAAAGGSDRLEVRIDRDGTVAVNGWATDAAIAALLDDLGVRADSPAQVAAAQERMRAEAAR
ncbi:4Fe-4S single cluster domain-containing protein [Microbacterium sp. M3]|uniref:4Fe-4S single cluster domain-containing protein n=1 Tax=Microbacterium arthrosphaerae TaxID=792652 RepID=A0ABU4H5C3_9MICO|nr:MULTISPECIES: 4Fe-4S single cluster domain-containing protein [Microbacterium]MDW4574533.1 4Fe-4S single cluster domain-containing protein [Microbacterium arthrosphaerae]MDW7608388.1 4Fe-4S single cluster domain-containing protein [Microbacterium sp. M3]